MKPKINRIGTNYVVVSMIPTRPRMYELIDRSLDIREVVVLTPLGELKTLDQMWEQENMRYEDIRSSTYPVDSLSLEYQDFSLTYDSDGGEFFDKWEWEFHFSDIEDRDVQIEKVDDLIDTIG